LLKAGSRLFKETEVKELRSKKAAINFGASILLQLITAISGLIIPRLFIGYYGSEVNGLVSSLNQFLSYITFFEAGISGVIMASLYKPIANKELKKIDDILANTREFFKRIATAYVIYVIILAILYPRLIESSFSKSYIALLIIVMSLMLLFQYLFGIVNNIYLQATQKSYFVSIIQIIVIMLSMIVTVIGIKLELGVHVLKFLTVSVAILNPIGLYICVKKLYKVNTKVKGNSKNIKQRWDGIYHHISYFIQNNIDIMILTFVNLKLVSVYYVYKMITTMIRKFFESFIIGFKSALGDIFAKEEFEHLKKVFSSLEFLIMSSASIVFISLFFLIMPFIELYTAGITDIEYYLPTFAFAIVLAEAIYVIRIPYHTLIIAAGHFKQTRNAAISEALINVSVSLLMVRNFGIIGVAIGTVVSCSFRTVYYINYLRTHILFLSIQKTIKRLILNITCMSFCYGIFNLLELQFNNYLSWFINGIIYVAISMIIILSINSIAFKEDWNFINSKIVGLFNNKKEFKVR